MDSNQMQRWSLLPSYSVTPGKMRLVKKLVKAGSHKEQHPWISFDTGAGNFHQKQSVNKQIPHGNPQMNGFLHPNNHQPHLQCHEVCKSAAEQSCTPHHCPPSQQHCRAQLFPTPLHKEHSHRAPSWLRQQQLRLIPVQVIKLCIPYGKDSLPVLYLWEMSFEVMISLKAVDHKQTSK